jgi:hypothetical protein
MTAVKAAEILYFVIEQTNLANFTLAISLVGKTLVAKESEAKPKSSDLPSATPP